MGPPNDENAIDSARIDKTIVYAKICRFVETVPCVTVSIGILALE